MDDVTGNGPGTHCWQCGKDAKSQEMSVQNVLDDVASNSFQALPGGGGKSREYSQLEVTYLDLVGRCRLTRSETRAVTIWT